MRNLEIQTLDIADLAPNVQPHELLLFLELRKDDTVVSENLVLFARPKHLDLEAADIVAEVEQQSPTSFRVTLTAQKPALWTWLQLEDTDVTYSDNFVHLQPGQDRRIELKTPEQIEARDIEQRLKVHSLIDTYREPL